jgi:glycosyltransferase involved in cell wall biosynthesis
MPELIALLGRGEFPADGVADYCNNLASALSRRGASMKSERLPWFDRGWLKSFARLAFAKLPYSADWILLQYTALGWSRRGFPFGALATLWILRRRGARCGVVFHEPWRQGVTHPRIIDRVRASCQDWIIRSLHRASAKSVFTVPLASVEWLPPNDPKNVFIPLGPNIPEVFSDSEPARAEDDIRRTVSVFCLSGPAYIQNELSDIVESTRIAAAQSGLRLKVVFVGRGTETASEEIAKSFASTGIETENRGLQEPAEISRILSQSDALLCVRGTLNLRRGSAMAGIACGVPLVGYAGSEMGTPLVEAGALLVPLRDQQALGAALARVLMNPGLARELRLKNVATQKKYFSWDTIADSYIRAFPPNS